MRFFTTTFPVVLLLCASALPSLAATRTVQPGQSIQSAVNAANPGDTVIVNGGTYGEQVVIANNTNGVPLNGLSLVGKNGATLNGPGLQATEGITISANNVTVRGLTIQQYNFGILISNDFLSNTSGAPVTNTHIYNDLIRYNLVTGVFFDSDVEGADCHDNVFTAEGTLLSGNAQNTGGSGDGVDINISAGVHVHNNTFYNNVGLGVGDSGQSLTDGNGQPIAGTASVIDHNVIIYCAGGGVAASGAIGEIVTQNTISGNGFTGVLLTNFSSNCTVSYNLIDGNTYDGLELDAAGATQCTITHNIADYNGHDGFEVVYAPELGSNTGNVFSYDEAQVNKNFDAEDVSPVGTNTWTHDLFGKTNPPNLGK